MSANALATLISVLSLVLAVAVAGYTALRDRGSDTEDIAKRLSRLETQVEIFWRGVTYDAAHILHSPHPEFARRDRLLERFTDRSLSLAEADELAGLMRALRDDVQAQPGQRVAAGIVLRGLVVWHQLSEASL